MMSKVEEMSKDFYDFFIKVKDAWMQKEKGEGFKRLTTPRDLQESQSLGHFDPQTNLLGNSMIGIIKAQNIVAGPGNECNIILEYIEDVFRSSASIKFERGDATKEVLINVKPDITMPSKVPMQGVNLGDPV